MADGTLIFDTSLDTSGVEGGVKTLGSTMAGIGKTAAVGMATAVAAVGTATVATTKAIVDGAKETANYGDHMGFYPSTEWCKRRFPSGIHEDIVECSRGQ